MVGDEANAELMEIAAWKVLIELESCIMTVFQAKQDKSAILNSSSADPDRSCKPEEASLVVARSSD